MAGYRVGLLPQAAIDIEAISRWWSRHRLAAPTLFLDELEVALDLISENPEIGRKVGLRSYPSARTYVLRRTGYLVIYNVDVPAEEVAIARVRHGKRRPMPRRKRDKGQA
jgi:plasmid stabilization system protein ParE